jgi:hypothetical protein
LFELIRNLHINKRRGTCVRFSYIIHASWLEEEFGFYVKKGEGSPEKS